MSRGDNDRRALTAEFRQTARERAQKIINLWIQLEDDPKNTETITELRRELHSLKGESQMMGFGEASRLAHLTEDLVARAWERGIDKSRAVGDVVLKAADTIQATVMEDPVVPPSAALIALHERIDELLTMWAQEDEADVHLSEDAASVPSSAAPTHGAPPSEDSLRVSVDRIAQFSAAAEEMVIIHHRFSRLNARLAATVARARAKPHAAQDAPAHQALYRDLAPLTERLGELVHEGGLQASQLGRYARQLRLVPVGPLFEKFLRPARDLAREHNKEVRVEVDDHGVVVDKLIADRLFDPLLHLVRNAIDHGIEPATSRTRGGKPETGLVRLCAEREGGLLVVSVLDDGRGIDTDRVKAAAVQGGRIDAAKAASLSPADTLDLLFIAGFSTRAEVSEISGRGVGLDVVKRNVESLGGTLRLRSELGQGARFSIRVPFDISLTQVLLVRGPDGRTVALPATAVEGILVVEPGDLLEVDNRPAIPFRDTYVVVASLAKILGAKESEPPSRLVVMRDGSRWAGLWVQATEREAEVVIKPVSGLLASHRHLIGVCVLDEGGLALVLNPAWLVARAQELPDTAPELPMIARSRRILLVEDSAITRAMVGRILTSLGHFVDEAQDGQEGLEKLETGEYDLVLTDVDMPRMDGIELTRIIRDRPALSMLPVIILSARGSEDDKRRGMEAGADSYLIKATFSETDLSRAVQQATGQ